MTKRRTILAVVLGLIMALCLSFAVACGGEEKKMGTLTWNINDKEHVTVTLEDGSEVPETFPVGEELKFKVTPEQGYEVTVKVGSRGQTLNAKNGVYSYPVKNGENVINITVSRVLKSVEVTTKPTKNTYYAGEVLDSAGMVVTAKYEVGNDEPVTAYTINYPTAGASCFMLGDTSFTVTYGSKTSAVVALDATVVGKVTLDPQAGKISDEYKTLLEGKKTEYGIDNIAVDSTTHVMTFTFAKPLTKAIALPTGTAMSRGEGEAVSDYEFQTWNDGTATKLEVPAETALSVEYKAVWKVHLLDLTKIYYHLDETGSEKVPQLIVEGKFRAAKSAYLYLYEGKDKVELKGPTIPETGEATRGDTFKLTFDMREIVKAGYIGKWMDIKFVAESDGIKDTQEIKLSDYVSNQDFYNKDDAVVLDGYRYHFEEDSGLLKACASTYTSLEYTISVKGDGTDDMAFVFSGKVKESIYFNKTAVVDFYIGSTKAYYGTIGADGAFTVEIPLKDWSIGVIAYAHFSIIESQENTTKLFPSSGEYNLPNSDCKNTDFVDNGGKAPDGKNGDLLREGTIFVHNEDYTRVFYIGKGRWDGIIAYGYNERASLEVVGDVALKVDSMTKPTKVYYVVKVATGGRIGYTRQELIDGIKFGNTDGGVVVYNVDAEKSTFDEEGGKVKSARLWFDVTGHAGKSMLWSNLYQMTAGADGADPTYEKLLEIKDSDRSTNGLYAIAGGNKYTILCTSSADNTATGEFKNNTYNSCNLVVETTTETANPETADPTTQEVQYSFEIDFVNCELKSENGKPMLIIKGTLTGFKADEIYFDLERMNEWSYIIFENIATVEPNGNFTLKVDFSTVPAINGYYLMHIELKPVKDGNTWKKEGDNVVHGDGGFTQDLAAIPQLLELLQQKWPEAGENSTLFQVSANSTSYSIVLHEAFPTTLKGVYYICLEVKGDAMPSITVNEDAVLEKDEAAGKVYFKVTATVENYTEAALKQLYIGNIDKGNVQQMFPCAIATIAEGVATLKFDITDATPVTKLYLNLYDGNTASAKKLQDIHRSSGNYSTARLGTKYYQLYKDLVWSSALLDVTDDVVPKIESLSSVALTKDDTASKAYMTVTLTVKNNTTQSAIQAIKLGNVDGSTNVKMDCVQATLDGTTATLKFDITSFSGKGLYCNLYYDSTKLFDLQLPTKPTIASVTLGTKTYSVSYSQWNNVLLNVEDTVAPTLTVKSAELKMGGGEALSCTQNRQCTLYGGTAENDQDFPRQQNKTRC